MPTKIAGGNFGPIVNRVSYGTTSDDMDLISKGLVDYSVALDQSYFYRLLSNVIPRDNPSAGSFVYPMSGRSLFEGILIGTGADGDIGQFHAFLWKPVRPKNAAFHGKVGKIDTYNKALWVRRPVYGATFTLGTIVGVAGTDDGWGVDWSTVRLAKEITEVADMTIDPIGVRTAVPTDGTDPNDIASFQFDTRGAPFIEFVISRGGTGPTAPDSVGILGTRI